MDHHSLDEILSEEEKQQILKKALGTQEPWKLGQTEVKRAMDGLAGFLGDHFRLVLHVKTLDGMKKVNLFVKTVPLSNKPKAQFIEDCNIFKKEVFMFGILDELQAANGKNPWGTCAYLTNEKIIVMPDLDAAGYKTIPKEAFDLTHVLVVISSIARFHASFANYETRKKDTLGQDYCFHTKHLNMMNEVSFFDSDWMKAGAKLNSNFLKIFSDKYSNIPNLEMKLKQLFIEACDTLKTYEGVYNMLIHRDLWSSNMMFKYEKGIPVGAILLDFQLIRYAPPAFDVTSFLYLTTSRAFRTQFEEEVYKNYYSIFCENIDENTTQRLKCLNYNFEQFREWCDKSRLFAIVEAIMIFPYVLMDPQTAEKVYDDPDTFEEYLKVDRTPPVVEYAKNHTGFRESFLEICEEIVEKYIV